MTQEVQVNLTLWLEVDINKSRKEIEEYISRVLYPTPESIRKEFSLPISNDKYEIHSLKEEAEIYGND